MSFQDQSTSLLSRLHLSDLPRSAAFGIAALALVLVGVGVVTLGPWFGPSDFEVTTQPVAEGAKAGESGGQDNLPATGAPTEESASDAVNPVPSGPPPEDTTLPEASLLCVHVDGAVKSPGVFYLETGSRIIDAIDAAGGFTKKASTAAVNLAQSLEDGQQVFIPTQDEAPAPTVPSTPSSGGGGSSSAAGGGSSATSSGLVNINQASAEELVTLSGIGEATAAKIIADREANGPFQTIEDIKRVSGIGDKKFESLRDFICV